MDCLEEHQTVRPPPNLTMIDPLSSEFLYSYNLHESDALGSINKLKLTCKNNSTFVTH